MVYLLANGSRINRFWSSHFPLIGLILAGFALRLYRLGVQSLWYDETVSAYLASQSIPDLVAHTARDIHPPAYYLLLYLWTGVAGSSEFTLAFFSLSAGLLLIPLTYSLTHRLVNRAAALWAALLIAFSPYNIWYSQEVRMYTLAAALGVSACYWAWRAMSAGPDNDVSRSANQRLWLGYFISAVIGLYVLYYFAFLLIVLNLFFLADALYPKLKRSTLIPLMGVNGLVLAAYLPWLPIAWRQATNPPVPPWRTQQGLWSVLVESWSALSLGQSVEAETVWPILLLTLVLLILGVRYLWPSHSELNRRPSRVVLLVAYTFGPLMLIYFLSFLVPLYHVRYVFTYAPAFYILLAAGLVWLAGKSHTAPVLIAVGLILGASLFSIYQFHFAPRYRTDDFRAAVEFIQARWQPGDAILVNAGYAYPAFLYYADGLPVTRQRLVPYQPATDLSQPRLLQTGTVDGDAQLGWGDPQADFYGMSAAETIAALEDLSRDYARLWLLRAYDTVTDPTGLIRSWLADHAIPIEDQVFPGETNIRIQGFLFPEAARSSQEAIQFEDGLALVDWQLPDQSWQPGQTIHLKLWWQASGRPGTDYKMSLKLWTPSAELAAQGQDEWPGGTLYRATAWPTDQIVYHPAELTLPPELSPGEYWLNVELYHPETIVPLSRLDGRGSAVTLGPVVIQ